MNDNDVTKSWYFQAPPRERKVTWTSFAWEKITSDTLSNGFNIYKNFTIEVPNSVPSENQLNQEPIQEAPVRLEAEENKDNENEDELPNLKNMVAEKSEEDEELNEEKEVTGVDPIRKAFFGI